MGLLREMMDPILVNWGIVLGFVVLGAYIFALHRRNSALKKQLGTVNDRLTHMQTDVRRYLSTISELGAEPMAPTADLPRPVSEEKPPPQAAVRVLVADDNPDLLMLMREVLQNKGYAVTTAKSGIEAFEFISTNRPDMVVLDILMPQMNGLELLQKMKEAHLNTPVLIVTAYGDVAEATREFDNVKGIMLKPFHITDLLNRMNEISQQIR